MNAHLRYFPTLWVLLSLFFLYRPLAAQPGVYYETVEAGAFLISAWDHVKVHEFPNQSSPHVGTIVFTEEVRHQGREAFVRGENRNYLYVQTEDGTQGWVSDAYLVSGGGAVVILQDAAIFSKPGTTTAITNQQFVAGELVILSEFREGWIKLTGRQKGKEGWVQGYEKLSAEQYDIEAATLLAAALSLENPQDRQRELRELRGGRSFLSPEMQMVVDQSIARASAPATASTTGRPVSASPSTAYTGPVYYDEPATPYYPSGEDAVNYNNPAPRPATTSRPAATTRPVSSQTASANPPAQAAANPAVMRPATTTPYAYQEREVVDMATGAAYIRVKETGTIQPVKAKNPSSQFYAYHKSLPIGSKILLSVPGTSQFVELEIIARLRPDNPNMIGLGAEVIKSVYGEIAAKDVGSVSIEYPKP